MALISAKGGGAKQGPVEVEMRMRASLRCGQFRIADNTSVSQVRNERFSGDLLAISVICWRR